MRSRMMSCDYNDYDAHDEAVDYDDDDLLRW